MAEGEQRPDGGGDDENGKYPMGFRFTPTTEELVEFYLVPRLLGEPTLPNEFVIEGDAYGCDPEILTEKYKESAVDDTWYFLSPRYRKYRGGDRPVRRTADDRGRWKPSTGQSKPEEEEEEEEGASTSHPKAKKKKKKKAAFNFSENTLAYYMGSTKDETKTKWLMHELVVPETPDNGFVHGKSAAAAAAEPRNDMLLNRYVVCMIYKSPLKKWKEIEEAAAAEASTSSQSSGPASECIGEAAARAPSSSSRQPPAKRPAVERPAASGHAGAMNKGVSVSQTTLFPGGGRSAAPTRGNGGGSSLRMPPVGVGVGAGAGAAGHHGPPVLPPLVHWPLVYNNSMQGPVQMQRPPLVYGYGNRAAGMANANGQAAPWQGPPPPPVLRLRRPPHRAAATTPNSTGPTMMMRPPNLATGQPAPLPSPRQQQQPAPPPVLRLCPPHRAAATTPNSIGPTMMMMRPPNLSAGQPPRLPSPRQQQQQQPPPPPLPETDEAYRNRVYARMVAEMKLQKAQKDSAARAGQQQQIGQTSSAPPACFHDEGGDRPAGVETMVLPAQFPARHGSSSSSNNNDLAQRPQQQQSSSAAPAPAAAAVEKVPPPPAENVPSKQTSVPPAPGANEGSCKGDAATATITDNFILQILGADYWTL